MQNLWLTIFAFCLTITCIVAVATPDPTDDFVFFGTPVAAYMFIYFLRLHLEEFFYDRDDRNE